MGPNSCGGGSNTRSGLLPIQDAPAGEVCACSAGLLQCCYRAATVLRLAQLPANLATVT
jgi:hypothetical protein